MNGDIAYKTEADLKLHWDQVYEKKDIHQLGWYEASPEPSLQLIKECQLDKKAALLNVGAGATTLVDELVKLGYENIIANDLSAVALEKLKERLGEGQNKVSWVVDNLIRPTTLNTIDQVDLWHDRAVLHFFTEEKDQDTYFELLKKLVKPGGYVILAAFNLNGATKCSGLPVYRYDKNMLAAKLGDDFFSKFAYTDMS